MTHDELLAKVNWLKGAASPTEFCEVEICELNLRQLTDALRAVVELAKETSIIKPYTVYHMGYQTAIKEVIQAIEEQLK